MGYLLVNADVLREKGIEHFEKMPDGRAITDFSMLRMLGSVTEVEIVSTAEEMLAKIKEEEESGLYDNTDVVPEGENHSLSKGEQMLDESTDTAPSETNPEQKESVEESVQDKSADPIIENKEKGGKK